MPDPVFQLSILPMGAQIDAPATLSLLEAAQAAGVRLPRSCRNGTCRACMCRLEQGQVNYRIDWPGLSLEERAEGWILPCVAVPASNLTIQAPAARRLEK